MPTLTTVNSDEFAMVSVATAAELLDTSVRTIWRRIAEGSLPARKSGRLTRIRLADIRDFGTA